LRWVVDVDAARGSALAAAHGAVFSTSVDEMLADPDVEIRRDRILRPTSTRSICWQASGGQGRAVRKADRRQPRPREELPRRRARAKRSPASASTRRFDVNHRAVYDRVRAGAIGKVESVHIVIAKLRGFRSAPRTATGGLLREKGTHFFRLACWMAGSEPAEVYTAGGCLFDPEYARFGDVDTAAF
jgi:myo-inositol 2-dehydrogenase/D-chiro-inositol 1-dehydrogenase